MPLTKVRNQGLSFTSGVRNLIINGAMEVSQRGTSFTSVANTAYTLDRFAFYDTGAGVVDISQATDTPNGNFKNSLKVDVTTADSSLAAGDLYAIIHHIEGTVSSHLGWGTSDAKNVTLSFWVKSPKTGTHSVAVQNNLQNRSRSEEYTVSSANTWEHKSVKFVGDTGGTWVTTTGLAIRLSFPLAAGSNFTQAAGSWGTGNIYASPNQVNCMDDAANNFYITGVQLEVGDSASDFEHRSFADELRRCQRYYFRINEGATYQRFALGSCANTNNAQCTITLPVTMRATPSVHTTGTTGDYAFFEAGVVHTMTSLPSINTSGASAESVNITCTSTGNFAVGNAGEFLSNANTSVFFALSAEL